MEVKTKNISGPEKVIPGKSYNITIYVANDGSEFRERESCLLHEHLAEREKILKTFRYKRINVDDRLFTTDSMYFKKIENEDQLAFAKEECGVGNKVDHVYMCNNDKDGLKIGDWYYYNYEDGGDYPGTYYIYTLDYIKSEMLKTFEKLNTIE